MTQLAEPVVSFLVERIGSLLIEEGKFLHGVRDQAEQLQSELKLMQSLLQDADARQHEMALVKEWISQSKDLAYEAENVLESYAFKLSLTRRKGVFKVLKRYTCILNECYRRHKFGMEVQSLNTRVSNLTRRFQEYGIRAITEKEGPSSRQQQLRRTYSHIDEDGFVGLYDEVEMVVQQLVDEKKVGQFRVVSIFGMGGLGKSTIARKVYNHPKVRCHFDNFAWVSVSQQWEKNDILKGILIKMIPEKRKEIEKWRDEELIRQLFDIQQRQRCLIALDDVWSTDAWECIKHAFPTGVKRNKILLTTRNRDVAVHIDPNGFHYEPRLLNDDESWNLLQKKALREHLDQDSKPIHELEKFGRKIAKFCRGLPLAVVALGGTLVNKHSSNEWSIVYKNVKSHLGKGESIGQQSKGEVQKILALSYDDLPYQLKPCFLYLSMFMEDEDIDTSTLYDMWTADGMVLVEDRMEGESLRKVADRYLRELAKRCMVQVQEAEIPYRRLITCRLHDLMRDLCLLKAKEEHFFMVKDYRKSGINGELTSSSRSHKFHGLVVQLGKGDISNYIAPRKEMSMQIRSLSFSILDKYTVPLARAVTSQFQDFKMLRILRIQGILFDWTVKKFCTALFCPFLADGIELSKNVGKLIHLRYFCLKGCSLLTLSSSIGNLEHLETLDLSKSMILLVPDVLWKMRRLRYLYLPRHGSVNRNLYVSLKLDGLNDLEILRNWSDYSFKVKDLYRLPNLRVLQALLSKYKNTVEMINYVSNSSCQLQWVSLKVSAFDSSKPEEALMLVEKLFLCSNIHQLKLKGPLGKLPEHKPDFCQNLFRLTLDHSMIEDDPMEVLEKLPSLVFLGLYEESYVGEEMVCHAMGFPQLKGLDLRGLGNLKKWMVDQGSMPNLKYLWISNSRKLEMIPEGLRSITSLEWLGVTNMPEEFTNRLKVIEGQEGEDFNKVSHVPSIIFR